MIKFSVYIELTLLFLLFAIATSAQDASFPIQEKDRVRYNIEVESPKWAFSGVGMLLKQEDQVVGAIFNEFGVSVLNFSYQPVKKKIKLFSVMEQMNRWYFRRMLKRDLKRLMSILENGGISYVNEKYKIKYTFIPIQSEDATTE